MTSFHQHRCEHELTRAVPSGIDPERAIHSTSKSIWPRHCARFGSARKVHLGCKIPENVAHN